MKFLLFTRANTNSPQIVSKSPLSIQESYFSSARKTKFIIHGFHGGHFQWVINMAQAILIREDANVFAVDWSKGADNIDLQQAAANTRVVGALIAQFITQLHTTAHAQYGDFQLIGHSLGAHIAGYAGERIAGLGRITGFGIVQPVGHVDYFPNGGEKQTGCPSEFGQHLVSLSTLNMEVLIAGVGCSHMRVIDLFIESINSDCEFRSYPCSSRTDFLAGRCNTCGTGCANMGYDSNIGNPRSGTYYLSTNGKGPYCQG